MPCHLLVRALAKARDGQPALVVGGDSGGRESLLGQEAGALEDRGSLFCAERGDLAVDVKVTDRPQLPGRRLPIGHALFSPLDCCLSASFDPLFSGQSRGMGREVSRTGGHA